MSEYKIFTSESVSEGHPDKMADQISDAVLDAMLKDDPDSSLISILLVEVRVLLACDDADVYHLVRADHARARDRR